MNIVQALFSAKGRMRRRDYWIWSIVSTIIFMALQFLAYKLMATGRSFTEEMTSISSGQYDNFAYAYYVLLLLNQWPMICIAAKRWHDRNRSGMIPVFMAILAFAYLGLSYAKAHITSSYIGPVWIGFNIIYYIVIIWAFVECGCLDGTKGSNKYGPSPKGLGQEANVF